MGPNRLWVYLRITSQQQWAIQNRRRSRSEGTKCLLMSERGSPMKGIVLVLFQDASTRAILKNIPFFDTQVMMQGCWDGECQATNRHVFYQIHEGKCVKVGWEPPPVLALENKSSSESNTKSS